MSNTKSMSAIAFCAVVALLAGCTKFNTEIPADFPTDVPIISGEIYRAEKAYFEDGPGFVVDIHTTLPCEEDFDFYADVVGPRENGEVRVETTCDNKEKRYVSIAVHLGQEGAKGLNMDQFNRLKDARRTGQFHELTNEKIAQ